jgi:signal transduction histidine kinase
MSTKAPGLLAVLLLVLLAVVALRGLNQIGLRGNFITAENLEASARISDIAARTRALDSGLYRLMAMRAANAAQLDVPQAIRLQTAQTAQLVGDLTQYRAEFAGPDQISVINAAVQTLTHYEAAAQAWGTVLQGDYATAAQVVGPYDSQLDAVANALSGISDQSLRHAREISDRASDMTRQTGMALLFITVIIAGCISLLTWRYGRRTQSILLTQRELAAQVMARTAELDQARIEAEDALAEIQQARRRLVDAEQMAALGSLVAGVAHEINTPVGTALTAATLLEDQTRKLRAVVADGAMKRADFTRYLDLASDTTRLMLSNIHRAAGLIQSFKQVAVDQTSAERRRFDLADYLREVVTSLSPQLHKASVKVEVICANGIEMDSFPGALSQVVTNLVMNALLHAFEGVDPKLVRIEGSPAAEDAITLIFTDNGCGIPEENLARIFEPFFTTKRGAGGTGLGLHIVYSIVTQQLGGTLAVESTVGEGTVFSVALPLRGPA